MIKALPLSLSEEFTVPKKGVELRSGSNGALVKYEEKKIPMKNWGTTVVVMANPNDYMYYVAQEEQIREAYGQAMRTIKIACAYLPVVVGGTTRPKHVDN